MKVVGSSLKSKVHRQQSRVLSAYPILVNPRATIHHSRFRFVLAGGVGIRSRSVGLDGES